MRRSQRGMGGGKIDLNNYSLIVFEGDGVGEIPKQSVAAHSNFMGRGPVEFSGHAPEAEQAEAISRFASRGGSKPACRQNDKRSGRAAR
jgi:hypothetical protein